jgi:hypothetical protein
MTNKFVGQQAKLTCVKKYYLFSDFIYMCFCYCHVRAHVRQAQESPRRVPCG